jgi:5-deoxy-glucuronate isomerase
MEFAPVTTTTCLVRNTAARKGRTESVAPGKTASRHLHYGRIILDEGDAPIQFSTADRETALMCLHGAATVDVAADPTHYTLGRFDTLYVPRDLTVTVRAQHGRCDLAEIAAPVSKRYPIRLVKFADVQSDSTLHFETGGSSAKRQLNVMIGKNVEAGRIMAGVTLSQPGNWTSWPPHEHAAMLEEAYLYIDMPAPAFGIQLVYTNSREPELATIVRENDIVLMPQGYHPNVAAPGGSINFVWMMAANREELDRQYGVVNVQPEFAAIGSGLDAARR